MNEWWQSLAPREQTLVGAMGALFVIVMIYLLLLQPLFSGASDTRERVAEAEKKLEWMKKQAPRLSANKSVAAGPAGDTLISIVDRSTKSLNLTTRGNQKVGPDKLRVQFDQSSFENLIKWFGALHDRHGVQIEVASVTREEDKVGAVNASITIQKANN